VADTPAPHRKPTPKGNSKPEPSDPREQLISKARRATTLLEQAVEQGSLVQHLLPAVDEDSVGDPLQPHDHLFQDARHVLEPSGQVSWPSLPPVVSALGVKAHAGTSGGRKADLTIRSHWQQLQECAPLASASAPLGDVKAVVDVRDGHVASATVDMPTGQEALRECLVAVAEGWRFHQRVDGRLTITWTMLQ